MSSRRHLLAVWAVCAAAGALMVLVAAYIYVGPEPEALIGRDAERALALLAVDVALGAAALALLPVALRRPDGAPASALATALIVTAVSGFSATSLPAAAAALFVLGGRRRTAWAGAALAVAAVSTVLGLAVTSPSGFTGADWLAAVLGGVGAPALLLALGTARGRRCEARALIAARARLSQAYAESLAQQARLGERARIARDMHDSLSHRLSVIAMHAGALELREDLPLQQVRAQAHTIATAARAADRDLRSVLVLLREEEGRAPRLDLAELVADARAAGTPAAVEWREPLGADSLGAMPALIAQMLYRAVQEALTNARKHAPGQPITVVIGHVRGRLELRAENPVPLVPGQPWRPGTGQGLIGLRERVGLLAGTVAVEEPTAERPRFTVRVSAPLDLAGGAAGTAGAAP
ncbi:histidine kinase [Brevibacterium sp. BRM-1]|uniref:sensor histidine kinase n=1 Tax=Brevibacterium sp. BRM-1 TaxID=2999062 RepID=UPI00227DBDE2|nr:histidine kinase [Brevibacterium sp. BRM-1]WAL39334.1 histidine kinase [Brevibacterium sp. BRM-1]